MMVDRPDRPAAPGPIARPGRRVRLALTLATCGGIGYAPIAPGTFGSAVGLVLWAALPQRPAVQVAALIALLVAGIWSGSLAEQHFKATDPAPVVIDEVAGMLVTLLLNPVGWIGGLVAFVLFRVADVLKPYPAGRLERLHGGFGVMADDVMAAVYANLALRAILVLVPAGTI
jgi:phosphatidylglycerophosphatase A